MIKIIFPAAFIILLACTVNVYDYSTHTGGGIHKPVNPDTVYVEPGPPDSSAPHTVPPAGPDTVYSTRQLFGGVVETATCGNWTRHTLKGCTARNEEVDLEMSPIVIVLTSSDGSTVKEFKVAFNCGLQAFPAGWTRAGESSFSPGSSTSPGAGSTLPVVTGTELVSIVADRITFPFLYEESESFQGRWLSDGTLTYSAVFSVPDWEMRTLCVAQNITACSTEPEFRVVFGEDSRRLLQQFYDIFVVHSGEAPVLPVI